jgi:hypothetical protein
MRLRDAPHTARSAVSWFGDAPLRNSTLTPGQPTLRVSHVQNDAPDMQFHTAPRLRRSFDGYAAPLASAPGRGAAFVKSAQAALTLPGSIIIVQAMRIARCPAGRLRLLCRATD